MSGHEWQEWFDAAPHRVLPSGDGVEVAKARRLLRVIRKMVDLRLLSERRISTSFFFLRKNFEITVGLRLQITQASLE